MSFINKFALASAMSMAALVSSVQAQEASLLFDESWIRGSVPGQKNGAGYLVMTNPSGQPAELASVRSDRADRVELHTIVREDGVAKMREVQGIPVPANGAVKLEPGGYHIMFIGLKQPFTPGESVPVILNFAGKDPVTVEFAVQPPTYQPKGANQGATPGGGHGHDHGQMKGMSH